MKGASLFCGVCEIQETAEARRPKGGERTAG